jgi:Fe-S-cluster-containing dehydrogenase component/CRP-like cAMP-binding protein
MAKTPSRPPISLGSQAPYTQATRQAGPERWDKPFSPEMSEVDVDLILSHPIFYGTQPERFPGSIPLRGIIRNDTRLHQYQPGEIIVRRGDYGHSAFVIMDGAVKVLHKEPPAELLGRRPPLRPSVWGSFKRWLKRPHYAEQVTRDDAPSGLQVGRDGHASIFLQDVPGVLDPDRTITLREGELFGEIAALGRTPRTATVVAAGEALLLEIRWQGLREIRRFSPAWKERIDGRYRERSLKRHLAETPLMWKLSEARLQEVADATRFETYGEFDWHTSYQRMRDASARELMEKEPLIAREGDYPNGLLLVRSGFARVSRRYNHGERTESYLGKGQVFGLHEIVSGWRGAQVALRHSLRALGYVDLLFIPTAVIEAHVLPTLSAAQLAELTLAASPAGAAIGDELLEFMVAQRFINGRATMLIDMDRCTRCDDCVSACAATHDNNPRFIRQGPEADGVMVASACMHCVDPVCMIGCPTGAIYRENIDGLVGIDADTCIGCSVCANSCPYGTIQMVALRDEEGLPVVAEDTGAPIRRATKCDLCSTQPGGPACVNACPHDALIRTDMRAEADLATWLKR